MIAIVESRADRASTHVCEHLRDLADWERLEDDSRPDAEGGGAWYRTEGAELRSFEDRHLDLERPVAAFSRDPDLLVFASRHAGDTGPLLTGHFTGNVGPAAYGGEDHAVAEACPNALAALVDAFEEFAPEGYDVGIECTHHGPTDVGCPSLFAELGSDDEQWDDPAGARAVARAILALRGVDPHREKQVVGFGGAHYAPRFERIVRETPWAVGHVFSDWGLEALAEADPDPDARRALFASAFAASGADLAVVDGDRPDVVERVRELGHRVVSETWLRAVGDRPLDLVASVESTLGAIEEGVRFGDARGDSLAVVALPTDLVAAAEGVDPDRTRAALERRAVAFETTEGGTRIGERAAVPGPSADAYGELVADLAAILEGKYDEVRLEDGRVVARTRAFDPELAAELGVPEGPKFGALAGGESVTVDGRTVDPEAVREERVRRFSLPADPILE